jgi:hypothetical protein
MHLDAVEENAVPAFEIMNRNLALLAFDPGVSARYIGRRQRDIGPLVPANYHLRPVQLEFLRSALALDLL